MQTPSTDFSYPWETSPLGRAAQSFSILPDILVSMLSICPEEDIISSEENITMNNTPFYPSTENDWELAFSLEGEAETRFVNKGRPISNNIAPSTFMLFPSYDSLYDSKRSYSIRKKVQTNMLSIRLNTQQLKYFLGIQGHTSIDKLICPHESIALRAAQKNILCQMFNSTKHGIAHSLYLQGKGLELLSEFIESMRLQIHGTSCTNCEYNLSSKEIHAIQSAKDIYENNIINPPCLPELSRLVGLNITKLKRGFHTVYNTTPYACLREARMLKAGDLLASQDMNVSQVAWAVGYSNLGHFGAAFLKHYGTNPKAFQMGKNQE